jgi:trimethylamine--corrinoid protein Co-methyltransferase
VYTAGHSYQLLTKEQVDRIYFSALRILADMGMQIENQSLLQALAEAGLPVDLPSQRVRFPVAWVEDWIAGCEPYDWENQVPRLSASAGIYHSKLQDPFQRSLVAWDETRLARYIALARSLPQVGSAAMLGSRIACLPALEPLYERFYAWKWGAHEGGSISLDEICPYLYEFYQVASQFRRQPLQEVFHATVYLIPALKLGWHEAYQVDYFRQRGLRVGIGGSMLTLGANSPVTLAGAVSLNLAEQLALRIVDWALFGVRSLAVFCSIAPLDMRTTIRPFGRPEMAVANLMTAQVARHLRAAFSGHAGLADAKLPSVEAGYQKALSAIPTLLAGGNLWMDAGLLGIDEVCSPIQMILDNEFLSALKYFTRFQPVDDDTIALEMILVAGPGGSYVAEEHTASHFRQALWQPSLWSREMLAVWEMNGSRLDIDRAAEQACAVSEGDPLIEGPFLKALQVVIHHAQEGLTRA